MTLSTTSASTLRSPPLHAVLAARALGVRLYGGAGAGRVDLRRVSVASSGEVTDLRFRVAR